MRKLQFKWFGSVRFGVRVCVCVCVCVCVFLIQSILLQTHPRPRRRCCRPPVLRLVRLRRPPLARPRRRPRRRRQVRPRRRQVRAAGS